MSVINQMLQDLEQRRGRESSPTVGIKAVAARDAGMRAGWWAAALGVGLVIIALLAWLLMRQMGSFQTVRPVPAAPPAPVVAKVENPPPVADPVLTSLRLSDLPFLPGSAAVASGKAGSPSGHVGAATTLAADVVRPTGPEAKSVEEPKKRADKPVAGVKKPEASLAEVKRITPQQRTEYLYQQAISLMQQGRMAEAHGSLEELLKIAPEHAAARQVLVGILVEKKQYAEAEQLLRDGLGAGANQPEFVMTLARIQVERGDVRGALETLQMNLAGAKDHAAYQAFLAALLQRQGLHKQAIEHYQAALRLAPTASALVGVGISLQAENRLTDALEAFNRAKNRGGLSPELQGFVEQRLGQIRQQLK